MGKGPPHEKEHRPPARSLRRDLLTGHTCRLCKKNQDFIGRGRTLGRGDKGGQKRGNRATLKKTKNGKGGLK